MPMKKKSNLNNVSLRNKCSCLSMLALVLSFGAGAAMSLSVPALSLAASAALCLSAAPAHAATTPIERVADGRVLTKADIPISGAIVYLKDSRSQTIRTYICDQQGRFHFGELSQNTDYELWAESNGVRSKPKSISSFDNRNDYNFTLKIDTSK
jgi:hypothetical protein